MISQKKIDEAVHRLVKTYKPLKIYLFGSYAWGIPNEDSDLDFLVVIEKTSEKSYKRPVAGYHAMRGLMAPADILVYTKDEFQQLSDNVTTLCHKVRNEGNICYAQS